MSIGKKIVDEFGAETGVLIERSDVLIKMINESFNMPPEESKLVSFYFGNCKNTEDRTIYEIWDFNDDELEWEHSYIQWLFPLSEPSNFNPDAPLVTDQDVKDFKNSYELRVRLTRSAQVFCQFLGLKLDYEDFKLNPWRCGKDEHFNERVVLWKHANHNWLRITRMLTSLCLLGCKEAADAIFVQLKELHEEGYVSENSFGYWERACEVVRDITE